MGGETESREFIGYLLDNQVVRVVYLQDGKLLKFGIEELIFKDDSDPVIRVGTNDVDLILSPGDYTVIYDKSPQGWKPYVYFMHEGTLHRAVNVNNSILGAFTEYAQLNEAGEWMKCSSQGLKDISRDLLVSIPENISEFKPPSFIEHPLTADGKKALFDCVEVSLSEADQAALGSLKNAKPQREALLNYIKVYLIDLRQESQDPKQYCDAILSNFMTIEGAVFSTEVTNAKQQLNLTLSDEKSIKACLQPLETHSNILRGQILYFLSWTLLTEVKRFGLAYNEEQLGSILKRHANATPSLKGKVWITASDPVEKNISNEHQPDDFSSKQAEQFDQTSTPTVSSPNATTPSQKTSKVRTYLGMMLMGIGILSGVFASIFPALVIPLAIAAIGSFSLGALLCFSDRRRNRVNPYEPDPAKPTSEAVKSEQVEPSAAVLGTNQSSHHPPITPSIDGNGARPT